MLGSAVRLLRVRDPGIPSLAKPLGAQWMPAKVGFVVSVASFVLMVLVYLQLAAISGRVDQLESAVDRNFTAIESSMLVITEDIRTEVASISGARSGLFSGRVTLADVLEAASSPSGVDLSAVENDLSDIAWDLGRLQSDMTVIESYLLDVCFTLNC